MRSLLLLLLLVAIASANAAALSHQDAVKQCTNDLSKQPQSIVRQFCLAYLDGRKPTAVSTRTLAGATVTTTVTPSTVTSVSTQTRYTAPVTTTTVTDTTTVTLATTTTTLMNNRRAGVAPLLPVLKGYQSDVIADACLLYLYKRLNDPATTTTLPAKTATVTGVAATTKTTTTVTRIDSTTSVLTDRQTATTTTALTTETAPNPVGARPTANAVVAPGFTECSTTSPYTTSTCPWAFTDDADVEQTGSNDNAAVLRSFDGYATIVSQVLTGLVPNTQYSISLSRLRVDGSADCAFQFFVADQSNAQPTKLYDIRTTATSLTSIDLGTYTAASSSVNVGFSLQCANPNDVAVYYVDNVYFNGQVARQGGGGGTSPPRGSG